MNVISRVGNHVKAPGAVLECTFANLPSASAMYGEKIIVTDYNVWFRSNGTTWDAMSPIVLGRSAGRVTTTSNGVAADATLIQVTVPAGLMLADSYIDVDSLFRMTNSAGVKGLKVKVGGTTMYSFSGGSSQSLNQSYRIRNDNSLSAQVGYVSSATSFNGSTSDVITAAINTANSFTIQVTAAPATSTEFVTLVHSEIVLYR